MSNLYRYPKASLLTWYQATPEKPRDLQKRSFPIFTMDGWATAKFQRDNVGTLLSPTAEVSFILIEDIPHLPNCVTSHLMGRKTLPIFPILYIGEDYVFVAKGHEDDMFNPRIVREEDFSITQQQWTGEILHFRKTYWSNGNISTAKIEPGFPDWMNDDWEEGPQS